MLPAGGPGAAVDGAGELEVFTTRPDTLFGATYLVVAPEHPLTGALTSAEQRAEVDAYVAAAAAKSDLERTELQKRKTGVFLGTAMTLSLSLWLCSAADRLGCWCA